MRSRMWKFLSTAKSHWSKLGARNALRPRLPKGAWGVGCGESVPGEIIVDHRRRALADRAAGHVRADLRLAAIIVLKPGDIDRGRRGVVGDVNRLPGVSGIDAVEFPSARDGIQHRVPVGTELSGPCRTEADRRRW